MATAKRTKSGNYRVRIYSHTDASGKKHYESFTASTKAQAEMMANKFANSKDRKRAEDLKLEEALRRYMDSNKNVLSPSTLYGYEEAYKRLKDFYQLRIRKINSAQAQDIISALIDKGYSPKTVKNTYAFFKASLAFSEVDTNFKVHLPSTVKKPQNAPESEDIMVLYQSANDTMKLAILFGCLSLRRGEISSLKYGDIKGNTLFIHSDMVWGRDRRWHYKEVPKTDASYRTIYLPDFMLDMIGKGNPKDYIMDVKPNAIGNGFLRLKKKVGVDIRFHDLRHYFASLAKVLDVPDNYTASLGGWRNGSNVLKQVYQNNIVSMEQAYAEKINDHLKSMTQNMTHENKKAAQP